jgi:hypothetical protein
LIHIAYILAGNPIERVKDFLAFSYQERIKYLRACPWGARAALASTGLTCCSGPTSKNLERHPLAQNADVGFQWHSAQGYRLYSSLEHSDAWGVNESSQDWNEVGPQIGSEESDKHRDLALVHNYGVLADLLLRVCKFFDIDRAELFERVRKVWSGLGVEEGTEPSRGPLT